MIKLYFKSKIKKSYGQTVQKLYQILRFDLVYNNKKNVNWGVLKIIVTSIKKIALL